MLIWVDAGISGKKVEFGLNSLDLTTGDLDGILVTHEHSDHIKGLGVVARKCGVSSRRPPSASMAVCGNAT